jgi:1-acyl-sn-glycerol-3-phosphate acyltransferase
MAKKELFRYPFMGWHLRRSGQIPVDAGSAMASMRTLMHAVRSLQAGMPLVVFPEGGRTPDGNLLPFLPGAFFLAIKAGVDIVPMALVGMYELLPMNTYHIKSRPLEMRVGAPIATAGLSGRDLESLSVRVQQAVQELLAH